MFSDLHVAVIGAGVSGLAAASELSKQGASVTLFEKSQRISIQAASWPAGGMLSPFCESETADKTLETLGQSALDWWSHQIPEIVLNGTLVLALARDNVDLDRFATRTQSYQWLDDSAIAALEPDLAGRFSRGLFFPKEAHLNPRKTLVMLVENLIKRGECLRFGEEVTPLDLISERKFDAVVDARGFFARHEIPSLRSVRGEMLLVRCPDICLSRQVRLLHPRFPIYIVPREDKLFMVGASMIESDRQGPISLRSAVELMNAVYALHPAFAEADIVEFGTGLRPSFPDNMPRILEHETIFTINGMYRHGFLMAPILAMQLANRLKTRFCREEQS